MVNIYEINEDTGLGIVKGANCTIVVKSESCLHFQIKGRDYEFTSNFFDN